MRTSIKPDENEWVEWMSLDVLLRHAIEPNKKVIYQKLNEKIKRIHKN